MKYKNSDKKSELDIATTSKQIIHSKIQGHNQYLQIVLSWLFI